MIHGPLSKVSRVLAKLNDKGAGVFVTVNETDGNGRKKSNIVAARALWVDSDNGPLPDDLPLKPEIIVETSPGKEHGYFLLADGPRSPHSLWGRSQPLFTPEELQALLRRIRQGGAA